MICQPSSKPFWTRQELALIESKQRAGINARHQLLWLFGTQRHTMSRQNLATRCFYSTNFVYRLRLSQTINDLPEYDIPISEVDSLHRSTLRWVSSINGRNLSLTLDGLDTLGVIPGGNQPHMNLKYYRDNTDSSLIPRNCSTTLLISCVFACSMSLALRVSIEQHLSDLVNRLLKSRVYL